ncbi:MAG: MMPL family transporter, partial [Pirellulaceae bacterium]
MNKFANFFERHRMGLALAIIAMSAICAVGVAQLEFEDQPRGIFRTDDHSFRQLEEVFGQFGTDELNCMVLVESEELFAVSELTALQSLAADLKDVVGVKEILSIADSRLLILKPLPHPLLPNFALLPVEIAQRQAEIARQEALAHPLVAGRLLTADARKTLMIVRLSGGELTIDNLQPVVGAIREVLDEANQTGILRARMTGLPSIRVDVFTVIQRDYRLLLWLGAAMAFSMALLIFRQLSAAL